MKKTNAKPKRKKTTLDPRLFERTEQELKANREYKHLMIVSKQLNISI